MASFSTTYNRADPSCHRILFVNGVYDESVGCEMIVAGDELCTDTFTLVPGLWRPDLVQVGRCYLFTCNKEFAHNSRTHKVVWWKWVITQVAEVPPGSPRPATSHECSGVAVTAAIDSEPCVLLLRTRTSPGELFMCYYWNTLVNFYKKILQTKATNAASLSTVEINNEELPRDLRETEVRFEAAFAAWRGQMNTWELIRYRDLHMNDASNWREYMFKVFIENELRRVKRDAIKQRKCVATALAQYEESWRRVMMSDFTRTIGALAHEELCKRGAGEGVTAAEAFPQPGDEYWEIPKGKPKNNETMAQCAWRELWEEALGGVKEQSQDMKATPKVFMDASNCFSATVVQGYHCDKKCLVYIYSLEDSSLIPVVEARSGEHMEKKWVPICRLEQYLRPDLANLLKKKLVQRF